MAGFLRFKRRKDSKLHPKARMRIVDLQTLKGIPMSKRELIDTGSDKRYVRRDENGQFRGADDVGRASAADQRHDAKTESMPGGGDRGDRT